MPSPKYTHKTEKFTSLLAESDKRREQKDCTVMALAAATGVPYDVAHRAMEQAGRAPKRGAAMFISEKALTLLGFKARKWSLSQVQEFVHSYDPALQLPTTYHSRKYKEAWYLVLGGKKAMLFSRSHVSGWDGQELVDWAAGKAKRITDVWEIYGQDEVIRTSFKTVMAKLPDGEEATRTTLKDYRYAVTGLFNPGGWSIIAWSTNLEEAKRIKAEAMTWPTGFKPQKVGIVNAQKREETE